MKKKKNETFMWKRKYDINVAKFLKNEEQKIDSNDRNKKKIKKGKEKRTKWRKKR